MKRVILFCTALFLAFQTYAQSPELMSYQAVIRNGSGALVTSSPIGIQISILQGSTSGTAVFEETHNTTSNANGLISIEIGNGTLVSGDFSSIDWSAGPYFIKTETDPTGGTNYTITGVTQLLSVPYALHAKSADNLNIPLTESDPVFSSSVASGITTTDTAFWNNKLDSYTETDPIFSTSVAYGISSVDTAYWNNKLDSFTETDPVYGSSVAYGITTTDTANWNSKLSAEVDGSITNEIQTISKSGLTVTLSNGGGSFTDSINVYTAGAGIDITNNVVSANSNSIIPPGVIMPFAGDSSAVPAGWMLCDGSEINRVTYAGLFAVIGESYGVGDNATTFNLPDLRGKFLRGTDYGAGNDPDANSRTAINGGNSGDNVGSAQNDELQSHNHSMGFHHSTSGVPNNYPSLQGYNSTVNNAVINGVNYTGGSETRPVNVYVNFIIKL